MSSQARSMWAQDEGTMGTPVQNKCIAPRACILDYGSGNQVSVMNSLVHLGFDVVVSNSEHELTEATHIVLPGVGAFGDTMDNVRKTISLKILENQIHQQHKPFLGICVGLQILGDKGHEFGEHQGLGWVPGIVDNIDTLGLPLPHVGWNDVRFQIDHPLFEGLSSGEDFYFVNSFALTPTQERHTIATAEYGTPFTAAVAYNNIFGVQFHPEKSQHAGLRLLNNFMQLR
jgi:imidazole glycerol-phosphate synthase subunit HisH